MNSLGNGNIGNIVSYRLSKALTLVDNLGFFPCISGLYEKIVFYMELKVETIEKKLYLRQYFINKCNANQCTTSFNKLVLANQSKLCKNPLVRDDKSRKDLVISVGVF